MGGGEMATVEELWFSSLGLEVAAIDREVSRLEAAIGGGGGGEEWGVVAAARALRRRLEQQSAPLWLLLQDPARQSQVDQIHAGTRRTFHRMVTMLGPRDASPVDQPLVEKLDAIRALCRESAGYATMQQGSLPDAAFWRRQARRGLESDPWSSLVLLSSVRSTSCTWRFGAGRGRPDDRAPAAAGPRSDR